MIILDTNVLTELIKVAPAPSVVDWVASQPASSLFTTAITQSEILYSVGLLPKGERSSRIAIAAKAMFDEDFNERILAFNYDAAAAYADIAVMHRSPGRAISEFGAQIAAIARSTGAAVATRNVNDFEGCGIDLVNLL